jgi:hypothetical protein
MGTKSGERLFSLSFQYVIYIPLVGVCPAATSSVKLAPVFVAIKFNTINSADFAGLM